MFQLKIAYWQSEGQMENEKKTIKRILLYSILFVIYFFIISYKNSSIDSLFELKHFLNLCSLISSFLLCFVQSLLLLLIFKNRFINYFSAFFKLYFFLTLVVSAFISPIYLSRTYSLITVFFMPIMLVGYPPYFIFSCLFFPLSALLLYKLRINKESIFIPKKIGKIIIFLLVVFNYFVPDVFMYVTKSNCLLGLNGYYAYLEKKKAMKCHLDPFCHYEL